MAKSVPAYTWKNGFREPGEKFPWKTDSVEIVEDKEEPHYVTPPTSEILTSNVHNSLGLNTLRTWPTIFDGTKSPHGLPEWWKPSSNVDVLICGGKAVLSS